MATLVLLRHGQSLWNQQNLFTGWVDVPLSKAGIEEALQAGDQLAAVPFNCVFSSALARAQMTALLVLSRQGGDRNPVIRHSEGQMEAWSRIYSEEAAHSTFPIFYSEALNERMYGELQGLDKAETVKRFGAEQVQLWRRSYDVAPPGGESLEMTANRAIPYFKQEVLPHLDRGNTVLIVAHGNSLRAIMMYLESLSPDEVVQLELATGIPVIYRYKEGVCHRDS